MKTQKEHLEYLANTMSRRLIAVALMAIVLYALGLAGGYLNVGYAFLFPIIGIMGGGMFSVGLFMVRDAFMYRIRFLLNKNVIPETFKEDWGAPGMEDYDEL